jgi:hypothetical protein
MKEINAKITLDEESLYSIIENIDDALVDRIKEELSVESDFDHKIGAWADDNLDDKIERWIETNLDIEDDISDWIDSNFDLDSYLQNGDINLNDYIDKDDDYTSIAEDLLNQYSPTSTCTTSAAFTEAIFDAVRYLLLTNSDFTENIIKAIDRFNKKKEEQAIEKAVEEAKQSIIADYQKSVNEYFASIKKDHEPPFGGQKY